MTRKAEAEAEPADRRQGRSLLPVVAVIVGVLVALQALLFFVHAYRTIKFPYQLDYGEGPILQIALRAARGEELYPPIDRPPYVVASYVPLYYALCALGLRMTGPGFWLGRLLSLAGALAVSVFAGQIVWERARHRFASYLTAGLILAMPHFMVWSTLMRVDMLALGFGVVGFYLFTRGNRPSGVVLFSLGILTRRSTVAAMAAAFVADAAERGWRAAGRAFAAQAGAVAALIAGAVLATRGGMYRQLYQHTAGSVGGAWSWEQLWSLIWYPLRAYPAYFAIAVVGAIWCATQRERRLLFLWFAAAGVIFLTGGRIGSAHNYLLEPLVVGAIMFGAMWADLSRRGPGLPAAGAMALGGVLAVQMVWTYTGQRPFEHLEHSISLSQERADGAASHRVVERIREAPGEVLCQDTGLIVLAGREPPLMPFEFTQMARRGALDPSPVFRKVREGRYSLIVTRFNPFDPHEQELHRSGEDWKGGRWPDGVISGLVQAYELEAEVGPYFVFVPRNRGP